MDAKEYEGKVKGLKIRKLNFLTLGLSFFFVVGVLVATLYTAEKYDEMVAALDNYIHLEEQADEIDKASDYLTGEARMFVQTTDVRYAERYFEEINITRRREIALDAFSRQEYFSYEEVRQASEESDRLMQLEVYAMKLAAEGAEIEAKELPVEIQGRLLDDEDKALSPEEKKEKAISIIFGQEYQSIKDGIHSTLSDFGDRVLFYTEADLLKGQNNVDFALHAQEALLIFLAVINVLSGITIIFLVIRPLRHYLASIREQKALKPMGAYEFQYFAQVYNDISAENKAIVKKEAVLKHKAEHDLMTGLQNRVSAEEHMRELIEHHDNYGILVLLDLDDLKDINDTFGHNEGDRAILGIAETLKSHFRESDVIGRLGGDEFFVFLPGAAGNVDTISLSLTSLLRKLSGISVGESDERRVHCSIGCAVQTKFTSTFESLFKQADTALYHVKRSGKNHYAFYTAEMEQADYHFREQQLLTQQSTKKFESEDLQDLLNSIASFYQLVLSVNISTNSYYLMEEVEDGVFSKVPTFGALDGFVDLAAKAVHPEDSAMYYDTLSRKALMQAYQRGEKSIRCYFRFRQPEGWRWIEGNVIFYTNNQGDICDFTMLRWSDERANELERLWLQKVLDLTVTSTFEYICLLNLNTKEYFVHGAEENTHNVPDMGDFDEVTKTIRDKLIVPEERDEYFENAKIDVIAEKMKENGSYSYRYTMEDGVRKANFHWFEPTHTQVLMTVQRENKE